MELKRSKMKFLHIFLVTVIVFVDSYSRGNWFVLADDQSSSEDNNDLPTCAYGYRPASYILFTRKIPGGQIVNQDDKDIPLDRSANTAFIAHGLTELANSTDYVDMVSAWLAYQKMNIFLIQYDDDSCSIGGNDDTRHEYAENAISYLPKLGAQVARFTKKLVEDYGVKVSRTMMVGHSLGSHLVGFAGKEVQKLGLGKYREIIGLDVPEALSLVNATCEHRVCITDANFFVLFHTSSYPGTRKALGNIDYYFNGGVSQPGCDPDAADCSHGRSKQYFAESIRNMRRCKFLGRAYNLNQNTAIDKSQCTDLNCSPAGLQSIRYPARGTLYVSTSADPPYCLD